MTPEQLMEEVLPVINNAIAVWREKNTDTVIAKRVTDLLDAHSKEITMKLLGFDTHYGKDWELDHCNGRNGNSVAGDYLRHNQATAIRAWLSTCMEDMKPMGVTAKARFNKQMQYEYEQEMHRNIKEIAAKQVNLDTTGLLATVASTSLLEKYLQTKALLEGNT